LSWNPQKKVSSTWTRDAIWLQVKNMNFSRQNCARQNKCMNIKKTGVG
jgi:hypothetical protein